VKASVLRRTSGISGMGGGVTLGGEE